ncbi:MAG: hypothetical protein IIU16_06355 [Bacteroidales bacterium]|nr:hypothetical protein [Bacteroidales bacterium]
MAQVSKAPFSLLQINYDCIPLRFKPYAHGLSVFAAKVCILGIQPGVQTGNALAPNLFLPGFQCLLSLGSMHFKLFGGRFLARIGSLVYFSYCA